MAQNKKSFSFILSALFAALTAAGCFIQIPLPGGIPIVIQDMMAMLSGLMLGPVYGGIAVLSFIILGIIGLPVFSGKAGIGIILKGPTGGFIIGYLIGAIVGGLFLSIFLNQKKQNSNARQWIVISLAAIIATVTVFALGIAGFMLVTHKTFIQSAALVLLPFIPGNIIKAILMVLLTKKFRPVIYAYTK